MIKNEIKIHFYLSHKNIIKLHHAQFVENQIFLIMDLAQNGNLY